MSDATKFVKSHKTVFIIVGGLLVAYLVYRYMQGSASGTTGTTSAGSVLYSTAGPAGPRGPAGPGGGGFQQAEINNIFKDLNEGVTNQKTKTPIPIHKVS